MCCMLCHVRLSFLAGVRTLQRLRDAIPLQSGFVGVVSATEGQL